MPLEIKLSQLQDRAQFEQAVAEHIERLVAFNREIGKPRPVAHPLIEAAVKRVSHPKAAKLPDDFMADYVIVDDTPPPPPPLNLEDRKRALVAQLRAAEAAAKEAVLPQRKLRLLNLNYQQAMATLTKDVINSEAEQVVKGFHATLERFQAVELHAAKIESDIEDLTDDTIDSFQVPNFG